jgi:hypothetical protein
MIATLGAQASAAGIKRFTLTMQADNTAVIRLVRRLDPSVRFVLSGGVYEATIPVTAGSDSREEEPAATAAVALEEV